MPRYWKNSAILLPLIACLTLLPACARYGTSLCPTPLIPPESVFQDWQDRYQSGERLKWVQDYTVQQERLALCGK